MLYNQNKSCVKSCKKTLLFKKKHCFPTCALFYPIVLKQKIITDRCNHCLKQEKIIGCAICSIVHKLLRKMLGMFVH